MKSNSYFYIPIKSRKKKFVGGAMAVAGMGLQIYQMIQQNKQQKEAAKQEDALRKEQEAKEQHELERQQFQIDSEELKKYPTRGYNVEGFYAKGGWIQKATASIKRRGTEGVCTGSKFGSSSCPPGSRRYNLAKTFKKMAKNKALGGVIDTDSKETTIAPNAIQVNTNKKGTDKIKAKVAGEDFNLDNNEVVVKDSWGRIVAISDDLGEASRYRYEMSQAQGNPRLQSILNDKYANRAISLENKHSKRKQWGGYMDGEDEYPYRMPTSGSYYPPFVKVGFNNTRSVDQSQILNPIDNIENQAPNYNPFVNPNQAGRMTMWDSARTFSKIPYYGLDGRTPYQAPSDKNLQFANPKIADDRVPESYSVGFANPNGANKPISYRGQESIFETHPVNGYNPYYEAEQTYTPDPSINKSTIGQNNTAAKSGITGERMKSLSRMPYINKTIEQPNRFIGNGYMSKTIPTQNEIGGTSGTKPVITPTDTPVKNKFDFNQIAGYAGQAGQIGMSIWNIIENNKALKKLRETKFPDFKYPRYKSMNIDVNRPEYENTVSNLKADRRSMESLIERGSTSSQDALARIAASRLGTGRNINDAFAKYSANRGGLYNADVNQRNQFMTNRYAAQSGHDLARYQDTVNRINTALALKGSSINSMSGFLDNLQKGVYQSEELKAIGASLGVKLNGYETVDQLIAKIKQATLTNPLKES